MTESTSPELRFFLPSGPPLQPKRWQRKWKTGIRVGSIVVATLLMILAVGAVVIGVISASTFTASGVVEVDCASRTAEISPDIRYGAPVRILDASSGEVYGTSTLGEFTKLKSGICLLGFSVDDVPIADLYTVRIGAGFDDLASAATLQGGALIT